MNARSNNLNVSKDQKLKSNSRTKKKRIPKMTYEIRNIHSVELTSVEYMQSQLNVNLNN